MPKTPKFKRNVSIDNPLLKKLKDNKTYRKVNMKIINKYDIEFRNVAKIR